MLDLSNHHQPIQVVIDKHSQKLKNEYRMRLEASIDVSRLLLQYGLPFRGLDESKSSTNQGFFLGFLRWHGDKHLNVENLILENAPQKETLTCPIIQKNIANACAKESLKAIIGDLIGDYFGILVDESKYICQKNKWLLFCVLLIRMEAIYSLLSVHSLSPSKIRGQGYDGAIGGSFKRRDLLRDHQAKNYAHHLRVEVFFIVIDVQLQELNDRFDVMSSDLLLGMGSLNSINSFSNFDKGKITTLAKCYPSECDDRKIQDLIYQLDTFIIHMRSGNLKFSNLQGIRDLEKALVEANLAETYSLVYLLVKLTLILHVATTTVERAFFVNEAHKK
ncbi:uncharacterized protein LOC114074273 [Solanum pennellii]|uniref:Uncharacterized protein LOC114074273 n=1 Tax=Solanum pennellii TaxID=28526 RepID=A0ABM1UWR5_SOLPN|nr:uncharacterized protein LOC114074273 [Solanum pennellii]